MSRVVLGIRVGHMDLGTSEYELPVMIGREPDIKARAIPENQCINVKKLIAALNMSPQAIQRLSRDHLLLEQVSTTLRAIDLASTNGTVRLKAGLSSWEQLKANASIEVRKGDTFSLGTACTITIVDVSGIAGATRPWTDAAEQPSKPWYKRIFG